MYRHLKMNNQKKHKDWTEEKIKAEAKKIWEKNFKDNKTVL